VGDSDEDNLLRNCYLNSLTLAARKGIKSIAFPSISTEAYRFPLERAAKIALSTVAEYLNNAKDPERVIFICFSKNDLEVYKHEFATANLNSRIPKARTKSR
jgi:O-acetyl-ADP-ribose deacetylase (regulator of RNase III)